MNTDLNNAINLIKECNMSESISKDKSIEIINSLVNYIKIDPFDILHEIYKNYEVEEKEKPFINREYYKHTFRTDEDVEIGFYVDDNSESFYKNNVTAYYKITFWNDFNLITSKTYESGSHVINLGKMSPGEHVISMEAKDIYGRTSYRDYFEIRISDPVEKVIYTMTDEDLQNYNIDKTGADYTNTVTGFNTFIKDLDSQYNYIIIPNGTYQMAYGETINIKDNLTLDLNNSTFTLQPGQAGDNNIQIQIRQCYDSHIINGTIEGDYETHDYSNSPNNSEWVHGINLDGRSKYSSYENITVKNMTGYGSISGMGKDRNGADFCWATNYNISLVLNNDTSKIECPDFLDLTPFKVKGCKFFQIGYRLGYQGKPATSWYYDVQLFDENQVLVDSFIGHYYRRIYIPENVKYCKINSMPKDILKGGISMFAFKVPVNCEFRNVRHEMCRCVGCAPSAMESLRLIDCHFTQCGKSAAKCAFDSEDGWEMMHDFYMTGTVFENNFNNDFLTCAGMNYLLEKNTFEGDIFMWARCQNYTIRDNKVKKIDEGSSTIGTHHVRIYNNECSDTISSYRTITRNCKCTSFSGKGDKMDLKVINSEYTKVSTTNSIYHIIEQDQVIKYINAKDSKFLIEGEGLKATLFKFSVLDCDNRNFENCSFNGGKYILQSASGQFNTGKFTNCKFDKIRIEPSVTNDSTLTDASIVFKNCFLPIDGELLLIGPFAYSRGKINITFENCVIVDSGIQQSDSYHTRTNLIYALGKPTSGTITFKNCIIKKTEGGLLSGYGGAASDFNVEIIFEKTGVSSNLTVDSTYTSNVTITKK